MHRFRQMAARCLPASLILAAAVSFGCAVAFSCAVAWAAPTAAPSTGGPSSGGPNEVGLVGVRFGGDTAATRVVLDLDAAVSGAIVADESTGGHLVFALPPLLSTGPLQGPGKGLVTAWSIRDDGRGARLVLDVPPGASTARHFLIPPDAEGGRWRYVIDIRASAGDPLLALLDRDAPRPAAVAAPPAPPVAAAPRYAEVASSAPAAPVAATSAPAPRPPSLLPARRAVVAVAPAKPSAERGVKVVVIDAGHGGHDTGAQSLVRNEKDITLAAALSLRAHLLKMGHYRVVMTRDSDVFIPLETRVQIARRAGADLFISLHADSAGSDPTPHGASVYTLSDSGETRVNYVLGPREWLSRAGDGRTTPDVRQILLDLTQRNTRNRSSEFASKLLAHIGDKGVDLLPRSHRDANYFVLLAPDVPAVLLEMGFITNPGDEMRLTDPAQRDRLTAGIADAIDDYFYGGTRLAAGF
jgi:N-acetylmuramoyl-L-alanine amidase